VSRAAIEVVRELYAAFGAKDAEALRGLLAKDVRWTQCPGFPGGADRVGAESVIEGVMGGLNSAWRDFRVVLDRWFEAGDDVIVTGAYEGVHAETGKAMRSVFAHVYGVDGGVVTRFEQFADTWPMVEAMGGGARD